MFDFLRKFFTYKEKVHCQTCPDKLLHNFHWYPGCTCAAGGAYQDHSGHCDLAGKELIHDDKYLIRGF